jgi:hypothetical protein
MAIFCLTWLGRWRFIMLNSTEFAAPQLASISRDHECFGYSENDQIALSLDRYAKAAFANRTCAIKADEIRQNLQNEANSSSNERDDTIDLEPS